MEAEEQALLVEAAASTETNLDRQVKMRDRIKGLRDGREIERQLLAERKSEQCFRDNCEPLRVARCKRDAIEQVGQLHAQQQEQADKRQNDREGQFPTVSLSLALLDAIKGSRREREEVVVFITCTQRARSWWLTPAFSFFSGGILRRLMGEGSFGKRTTSRARPTGAGHPDARPTRGLGGASSRE